MNETIHLATDHAGFEMKEFLKAALEELGYTLVDHGSFQYDEGDDVFNHNNIPSNPMLKSVVQNDPLLGAD